MFNQFRQIVATMRPAQWVKNVFVFAPVIFASQHTRQDPGLLLYATAGTVVFILLAGAVYVFNDMRDVEKDRQHPTKRNRPLASGHLSMQHATVSAGLSLAGSYLIGYFLGWQFLLAATGYLVLNFAYSTRLKKVVYIDVLCIATGFLLRILAGCFAIPEKAPYKAFGVDAIVPVDE